MDIVKIREFKEEDAGEIGMLIADTYRKFNLSYVTDDQLPAYLGGYIHARSNDPEHQAIILKLINTEMVFVAEDEAGHLLGVLRGKQGRLQSLFVNESVHRRGIGRMLCERFENICRNEGVDKITLAASLYAVPFYLAIGYKKSTGKRSNRILGGPRVEYQPMKKVL